jgi:oligopeptide/dipeptide ABC transporter ATP-binding protein
MTADILLQAHDVSKVYYDRAGRGGSSSAPRGIHSVSLQIREGEIFGLVGESGCGKSTFAKVLVGLEQADRGTLTIDGHTLFSPGTHPAPLGRRPIQMVFQDPYGSLNPRMRVRDLVGEGLRIERKLTRSEILEEVTRQLQLVGLGPSALDKYPHEFSGGQRQRICIARALILRPKVLIADEAVSALDVSVQMQILNLLLDLRDRLGLGILFISHDMDVIEYLCDRVAVMYAGRIVEENTASTLLDAPRHPYTAHLRASRPGGVYKAAVTTMDPPRLSQNRRSISGGCAYAAHCLSHDEQCLAEVPILTRDGNAAVACFHLLTDVGARRIAD